MSRARLIGMFVVASGLIMVGALASIFVGGLKPQIVAPVAAMAVAACVFIFASRFGRDSRDQAVSVGAQPPPSVEQEANPGITLVRFVIVAMICIIILGLGHYGIEAWKGTLDTYSLQRFIPKAVFGLVLAGYVLRKIRIRQPF